MKIFKFLFEKMPELADEAMKEKIQKLERLLRVRNSDRVLLLISHLNQNIFESYSKVLLL